MNFASMSGLWFALSLPAIVLLYLLKRKYVDTPVSSHMLWNRTLQELAANRPWQKLRSRLLMIVQLLAAALLVLALMNPQWLGARQAAGHIVFVIDRSASMSAAGNDGGSRLDEAKRRVLGQLAEAGEAVTLLAVGGTPELLAARSEDPGELRAAVEALEPYYGRAAYGETLSLAEALTRNEPDAEVRFVTDGQIPEPIGQISFAVPFRMELVVETGAGRDGGGANGAGVEAGADAGTEEEAAGAGTAVDGAGVDAGGAAVFNAAVAQFGVRLDPAGSGTASASASIRYWGAEPREIGVELYADGIRVATRDVRLEPGRSAAVFFDGLAAAEWYRLTAETGDAYVADDTMHAFLAQDRPRRVLLVSGGNLFLEKALRLAGAEVTLLAPENAETWAQTSARSDAPDLIVVDNAELPDDGVWARTLAETPALLIRSGYAGTEQTSPPGPYEVSDHPVNRYLSFSDVHVGAWFAPEEPFGTPIVSSKDGPLLIAGMQDGRPRLTLTFALQHSDWPLRSEFPVFVRNALEWLTENRSGSIGRAVAGEELEIEFDALSAAARWVSADTGESIDIQTADGRLPAGQQVPLLPGLYRLVETDAAGVELASRWLDVVADPAESSLAAGSGGGVPQDGAAQDGTGGSSGGGEPQGGAEESSGGGAGLPGGADAQQPQQQAQQQAQEKNGLPLWRLAVALTLAMLAWEWGVYRRGLSV